MIKLHRVGRLLGHLQIQRGTLHREVYAVEEGIKRKGERLPLHRHGFHTGDRFHRAQITITVRAAKILRRERRGGRVQFHADAVYHLPEILHQGV